MHTLHTYHLSMNEFADAVSGAAPGEFFIYAVGDLAISAYGRGSAELKGVRRLAQEAQAAGEIALTQRRRKDLPFAGKKGCCSFEYIFTRCAKKLSTAAPVPTPTLKRRRVDAL